MFIIPLVFSATIVHPSEVFSWGNAPSSSCRQNAFNPCAAERRSFARSLSGHSAAAERAFGKHAPRRRLRACGFSHHRRRRRLLRPCGSRRQPTTVQPLRFFRASADRRRIHLLCAGDSFSMPVIPAHDPMVVSIRALCPADTGRVCMSMLNYRSSK